MILGLSSANGGMTVRLWELSSLDGHRPPWYRALICPYSQSSSAPLLHQAIGQLWCLLYLLAPFFLSIISDTSMVRTVDLQQPSKPKAVHRYLIISAAHSILYFLWQVHKVLSVNLTCFNASNFILNSHEVCKQVNLTGLAFHWPCHPKSRSRKVL